MEMETVDFIDLKDGDIFCYDNKWYIKIGISMAKEIYQISSWIISLEGYVKVKYAGKDINKAGLWVSIQHWHENLDILILNKLSKHKILIDNIYIGSSHCPLCNTHFLCRNCVIGDMYTSCSNTPWVEINRVFYCNDYDILYDKISAELEFLYTLYKKKYLRSDA